LDYKNYKDIKDKKPELVFIIDYALPKEDILELKKIVKDIYLFDHHKQEKVNEVNHINPFTDGNFSSLDFPSAGWIINEYFGKSQEIFDLNPKI
jgi:spore coat polysaccharide biosynthesis predicted glycosyltransferase SpsG